MGPARACSTCRRIGADNESPVEADAVADLARTIVEGGSTWVNEEGEERPVSWADVLIVAPYNAQVGEIKRRLPATARVGTVDKFQGQEAPISIYSMTTSSPELAPRGMDFLYSRHRLNVATSRARCISVVVASPGPLPRACADARADAPCECVLPLRGDGTSDRLTSPYARGRMIAPDQRLTPSRLDALRKRTVLSLVSGVALGSTGHIAAATVATIVAGDIAGTSALAGAPGAAGVLGAAVGSTLLSRLMVWRGRRLGLSTGYLIGVGGAFVATAAVFAHSLPALLLGTALIGFGNSSNQLSRYTAADLYPVARRATAIGIVVWGATVGAVIGPNLVGLLAGFGETLGWPPYAGAYLLPVVFVGAAAILSFVMLRPDPYTLADRSESEDELETEHAGETSIERILRRPNVPVAIVALVTVQVVMVLIMTMTPLHMTAHGHGLTAVGLVISAHTFGMFALSPVSGRLTDRFGSVRVVLVGLAVVAFAAVLSAAAPPEGGLLLLVALFLLGYGWNMGYVAGSTMLTSGLGLAERTRIEGLTDSLIWSSAAVAAFGSGVVVAAAGFTALGLIGAAMVAIPVWLLVTRRRASAPATSG